MRTRESEEMYLETILLLKKRLGAVRAIDIAAELKYAKSSVSRAVNLLQKKGYIEVDRIGEIKLTETGEIKAKGIYERHRVITELLIELGAAPDLAEDNACRIEHVITAELFEVIKSRNK